MERRRHARLDGQGRDGDGYVHRNGLFLSQNTYRIDYTPLFWASQEGTVGSEGKQ